MLGSAGLMPSSVAGLHGTPFSYAGTHFAFLVAAVASVRPLSLDKVLAFGLNFGLSLVLVM
jgi:hypothetical protein